MTINVYGFGDYHKDSHDPTTDQRYSKIGARIIMTTNTTGVIRIETAVSFIFIVL